MTKSSDGKIATVGAVWVHETDNVATALRNLQVGETIEVASLPPVCLRENIPFGHKLAMVSIEAGGAVIKYGSTIGVAIRPIKPGEHVHVHNVRSARLGAGA